MDFPRMEASTVKGTGSSSRREFDMRDWLEPRRMTMVMWDHAFLTRHMEGDSFEDYGKVLDEAMERGYNTLRIDPMPQYVDLSRPDIIYRQPPMNLAYLPWTRPQGFEGPAGKWLIEFMEKVMERKLHYCLSSWWGGNISPKECESMPGNLEQGAYVWIRMLEQWKKRFGFERCVYVDINNEFPCFLPGMMDRLEKEGGPTGSPEREAFFTNEINNAMAIMREAFPELKFMVSLHGNVEYVKLDLELDCMDIHFYSDADPRWRERTGFYKIKDMFTSGEWHKEFSDRCAKASGAGAALYRARQRAKLGAFADMSVQRGIPLLTTESWASWYYIDSPGLNWDWLLEWAEWSVEDAIDFGMWGWTPHNYVQPQFQNWKDVKWHQRLTQRFLRS